MGWLLPAALLGSAAIGGITSLLSSNKAATTAEKTSAQDLAFQKSLMDRQLAAQAPYSAAGYGALDDLTAAYGQNRVPLGNPYMPLDKNAFSAFSGQYYDPYQGAVPPSSSPGGTTGGSGASTWQQFLSQFPGVNTSGGSRRNRRGDDEEDGGPAPIPSSGTTAPANFASGNELADYLMKYRNQVSKNDRNKFDSYLTQLRGMGAFPQAQAGTPTQNPQQQDLAARRADFLQRFKDSPLYQMTYQPALEEGTQTLQRNATAQGLLNSGRQAKAMARFAGNLGNQTYGGYESGLWNMAGFGPGQTPSGEGVSNAIQSGANAGYARAAGIQGVGNAVNNALGSYAYLQGLRSNSQF